MNDGYFHMNVNKKKIRFDRRKINDKLEMSAFGKTLSLLGIPDR